MEYKPRPFVGSNVLFASVLFLLGIWFATQTNADLTILVCFVAGAFWLALAIIELLVYIADVLHDILRKMK